MILSNITDHFLSNKILPSIAPGSVHFSKIRQKPVQRINRNKHKVYNENKNVMP